MKHAKKSRLSARNRQICSEYKRLDISLDHNALGALHQCMHRVEEICRAQGDSAGFPRRSSRRWPATFREALKPLSSLLLTSHDWGAASRLKVSASICATGCWWEATDEDRSATSIILTSGQV